MSEIQQFYNGQNIFITGATGFVGKILMEKLLRSCHEIGLIYILIRPKRGKTIQERLNAMIEIDMFEPLRKQDPNFVKKIVPLIGDATKPSLGLSPADRALIIKEVSIIFHAAASTRFDEPLKLAVDINVNSVMELISICKECKKLKAAVYVSTAFSNCTYDHIEEKILKSPLTYEDVTKIVEIMEHRNFSKEEEEKFTQSLLGKFPNTYSFTKSIAEGLVNDYAKNLPFCIYRFSIALSTFKEPIRGWVDTAQGLNVVLIGIGIGAIRVLRLVGNNRADIIPADFACNCLIASAWETSTTQRSINEDLRVYNYVSGTDNPITWNNFEKNLYQYGYKNVPKAAIYYPGPRIFESKKLFLFLDFFVHFIPCFLGDIVLKFLGKKPILLDIYNKGTKLSVALEFFHERDWKFDTGNVRSLWNKLSVSDKEIFCFDIKSFKWFDVLSANCDGVKKYILKEDSKPETRKYALRKLNRLYILDRFLKLVFITFIVWLIWTLYGFIIH